MNRRVLIGIALAAVVLAAISVGVIVRGGDDRAAGALVTQSDCSTSKNRTLCESLLSQLRTVQSLGTQATTDVRAAQLDPTSVRLSTAGSSLSRFSLEIAAWEEKLNSIGDDAQLANVDLQNILQKQQQTLQMMSNISKMLYDTAQATIRKIGG